MSLDEPILSVVCNEPDGAITRHVRFMTLEPANLKTFWEKSRQFRTLFSREVGQDFKLFLELFLRQDSKGNVESNGLFWVVDDFVGLFYMTDIRPGVDAIVHYTFFDRRHRGRKDLVRAMIKHVFERYQFRRLSVEVAMYATPSVFNFVESVGFKNEGRKRKAVRYDNDWFDLKLFGILREDV